MRSLNHLFNTSIKIEQIGTLYYPTVADLLAHGEDTLNAYLIPYRLSLGLFDLDEDMSAEAKLFDLFYFPGFEFAPDKPFLALLKESLAFFFREQIYSDRERQELRIGNQGILHRDNFDALADHILEIGNMRRLEKDSPPPFANERHEDIYTKIMAGRRKRAELNSPPLLALANIVMHGGRSFISYEAIQSFTINQLINSYNAILNIDAFTIQFQQSLVASDISKLDLEHWSSKLKRQ